MQRARFISEMMLQSNSVEPRKISERLAAAGQWEEPITGHYHFLEHHNTQYSSQKQFPLFPFPPNPSHSDDIVPLCTRQEAHAYKFNTTSLLCMTAIFFCLPDTFSLQHRFCSLQSLEKRLFIAHDAWEPSWLQKRTPSQSVNTTSFSCFGQFVQ